MALTLANWGRSGLAQTNPAAKHPRPGIQYIGLSLSKAINKADLDEFCEMLELSEGQRKLIEFNFDAYLKRNTTIEQGPEQHVWERSAQLASENILADVRAAQEAQEMFHERDRVAASIANNDSAFFAEIEPALSESQKSILRRLRLLRSRDRCRQLSYEYPGSKVDLCRLIWNLRRENSVTAGDMLRVEPILTEYESSSTALFERYMKSRFDAEARIPVLIASTSFLYQPEQDPNEIARFNLIKQQNQEEVMRSQSDGDRIAKRLHDLNADYVGKIAILLSEQAAEDFKDAFRLEAYSPVYPNPFELDDVLDAAGKDMNVVGQNHDALATITSEYRQHRDAVTAKMVRRYLDYREAWLKHRTRDLDEYSAYKADMIAFQQQRADNAAAALKNLRVLLCKEPEGDLARAIEQYERTVAEHKPREFGLEFWP